MASITYNAIGLPHPPHPAGSMFVSPVDGQTYISNGYSWVTHTNLMAGRLWNNDGDMNTNETVVRITKVSHDRFVDYQEIKSMYGTSLYLDFKRNKVCLAVELKTFGFNPVNALDRKVDSIKQFCNEHTEGLWSIVLQDVDFDSRWHQNEFNVKIDVYFEQQDDRLQFMKNYVMLDKLSS